MPLNMEKSYEMLFRGKVSTPLPEHIPSILQKKWLKLLGVKKEEIPGKWDRSFDEMVNKVSKRMYILRVCKHYELTMHQLDLLFNSPVVSFFSALQMKFGAKHGIANT